MSKRKRFLPIALCIMLILTLVAGCNGNDKEPDQTSASDPNTGSTTTVDPRFDVKGYEFVLGGSDREWVDNPTNALEEEMMEQYYAIEEELGCTITRIFIDNNNEQILTAGLAGDKLADFVKLKQSGWAPAAINNYIRPLESEELRALGFNTEDENMFDQTYTQLSNLLGHTWGVAFSGKYFIPYFGFTYVFNKRLLAEVGYTDQMMYDMVRNGTWDYETFIQICKKVSADTDGDGQLDRFGLTMVDMESELMTNKIGLMYEKDGRWVCGFDTIEFQTALQFLMTIAFDETISMQDYTGDLNNTMRRQTFYDGKAAFGCLYGAHYGKEGINSLMADEYGVIPIPKGPHADHYNHTVPDLSVYTLQYANKDWEKSAIIMAEIGRRLTDPEEADLFLKGLFRDEESYEMMKEYQLPYANIQATRFSPQIDSALDVVEEMVGEVGPAAALEAGYNVMTAAINELFKYD